MRAIARTAVLGLFIASTSLATPPDDELMPGLVGEYYSLEGQVQDFPAIAAEKKPTLRRVDKQINWDATSEKFAGTDLDEHFYVRWTGLIRIPKDGNYTFFLESDDGSRLSLGGKQIIDNGGLHAMEEKSGDISRRSRCGGGGTWR